MTLTRIKLIINTHDNGVVSEHFYIKNYMKHGVYKSFYINGYPHLHVQYKKGVLHGTYIEYHETDELDSTTSVKKIINYMNGKRHGMYELYSKDKTPLKKIEYNHGKIHGIYKDFKSSGISPIEINIKKYQNGILIKNKQV